MDAKFQGITQIVDKPIRHLFFAGALLAQLLCPATLYSANNRNMIASVNGQSDACFPSKDFTSTNNRILISWRMLSDAEIGKGYNLYREFVGKGDGKEKLNSSLIYKTNYTDTNISSSYDRKYTLTDSFGNEIATYTMPKARIMNGLPYFTIPTKSTADISTDYRYILHDGSIGDLDGDGEPEIVVRREIEDVDKWQDGTALHSEIWEAYKMDGTFMWRLMSGPNISVGNSASFAVYDFDGDGRCEIALRTCEGTVFADGVTIGDTNGDGKTDYRDGTQHVPVSPDFISVVDGATGRELGRDKYIPMISSEEWGDNYNKRAASLRTAAAKVERNGTAIIIARGIYAKMEIEAWRWTGSRLEKIWNWHCSKEYKETPKYYGQGFHSLSVGDVDDDGLDEIIYGACTIDHNGTALYSSELGHGDALHLGKFTPDRNGLQIWTCHENNGGGSGYRCKNYAAALRDARTGEILWHVDADPDNPDCGRALVADIDPSSPGAEMWWYGSTAHSFDSEDLEYSLPSINMAVWFDGRLSRQLLDKTNVDAYYPEYISSSGSNFKRPLQMGKYGATTVYGSGMKNFPIIYGDFLGDWREEIVVPAEDLTTIMVFTTWYPTEYSFPYLRSDHLYDMSMVNQNIGYNMPTQLSYYLCNDAVTIGSTGYSVFVPSCNVIVPSGVEAFYAKVDGINNNKTTIQLTEIPVGSVVNGGEAIILRGNSGSRHIFSATSNYAYSLEGNLLKSFAYRPPNDLSAIYVFGKQDDRLGFYKYEGSLPTFGIYLMLPTHFNAPKQLILDMASTGIESVSIDADSDSQPVYNITGQRVGASYKGIVIKNGEKCIRR